MAKTTPDPGPSTEVPLGQPESTTAPVAMVAQPGMKLIVTNEDGSEIAVAVNLTQQHIDELLRNGRASIGVSSNESLLSHVMHEIVIERLRTGRIT